MVIWYRSRYWSLSSLDDDNDDDDGDDGGDHDGDDDDDDDFQEDLLESISSEGLSPQLPLRVLGWGSLSQGGHH